MTRLELLRARQRADDIGRMGEELMDAWFANQANAGELIEYTWASNHNAIEPYDFRIHPIIGGHVKVEVKATCADFGQIIHVSVSELLEMESSDERYDLYRVYALDEQKGKLRIAHDMKAFASSILAHLRGLPPGATVDSISVKPDILSFGAEMIVDLTNETEEA